VFDRILLTSDLSQLPVDDDPLGMVLGESLRDHAIELSEARTSFDPRHIIRWEDAERQWWTSGAAIAESYAWEFHRLLDYVCALAPTRRIMISPAPILERSGVTFDPYHVPDSASAPQAGKRLRRLLVDAVRRTGKRPSWRGGDIIDLDHWLAVLERDLATGEALAVHPQFVPVVTEWLRADAIARREQRRMIRADLGLPADPESFGDAVAKLVPALEHTAARLCSAFAATGLGAYRDAARVVLDLQAGYPRGVSCVELNVVFRERHAGRVDQVPVIGLTVPPPDGYPLRLADGTITRMHRPPWRMAARVPPRESPS
jgi:hypothetical protein